MIDLQAIKLLMRYYAFVGSDMHMNYADLTPKEIATVEYLRKTTKEYFASHGFDIGFGDFDTIDLSIDIEEANNEVE